MYLLLSRYTVGTDQSYRYAVLGECRCRDAADINRLAARTPCGRELRGATASMIYNSHSIFTLQRYPRDRYAAVGKIICQCLFHRSFVRFSSV